MNPANDSNKNGKKDGAKKRKPQLQASEDGKHSVTPSNDDNNKDGDSNRNQKTDKSNLCQPVPFLCQPDISNKNNCWTTFGGSAGSGGGGSGGFLRSLLRKGLDESAHLLGVRRGKAATAGLVDINGTAMMSALNIHEASSRSAEDCITRLRTDPTNGLSTAEASRRLNFSGFNEFELKKEESMMGKYLEQFKNPLICLLLASAIVSVLMKQYDDALSIAVAVLIRWLSHCIRDGRSVTFYARELVPGDLVLLNAGDRVPADVRVIEAVQLQLDESSFTGENEAREKLAGALPENAVKLAVNNGTAQINGNGGGGGSIENMDNIAFMGTLVCAGRGKGIVIGTGANSMFGEVFLMMQSEESPKTPLQNSMDQLGKQLSLYSFGVIGLIFVVGLIQGRDMLEMFTIGVSLAVAAIPEGLPIVVAVTLAIGVMRMGNRNAVVKKLSAVETLGCVTVICSDKTGTLTKNEMTACIVVAADDTRAEVPVTGFNDSPRSGNDDGDGVGDSSGECRLMSGERVLGHSHSAISRVVEIGCVCNNCHLANGTVIGQPTEGALMVLARETQLDISRSYFRRLNEMPFSSDTKWMGVQVEPNSRPGEVELMLKGAIDRVLQMCVGYLDNGVTQRPLTAQRREQILHLANGLGQSGLRVIGMACGKDMYSLYYAGLVGIMDPPRPGCRQSIETVQDAGVSVKMVTGDALETAISIGSRLNIFSSGDNTLSGSQIDELSDMELERLIRGVSIFYRSSPRHKLRIVKALQNIGEVVAMTGDGVNDAVALKKSDIGVAMGNGTDVSKEAADMVLINDDFSTIKAAIEEGKGIYHNITNFVTFQLSTSVSAIALIAISTLFHFENPLNAMQILWINIIMDGPPAQSLGVERVDADIIRQPPRNVREPLINRSLIISILSSAAIIIAGTLFVFYKEMAADNEITPRDTTMTFTCFVLFDMWNALSCRSSRKMIWEIGLFSNPMFCLSVFGSLLCQCLVIYFAPLQRIFQTEALTVYDLVFLTLLTSTVFVFNEGKKYLLLRRLRYKQRQQLRREDVRVDCVDSKQKWSRRMNGGGAKMMI
uniref:P-type Ca(2+) transporter n=1 Tax=Globodera rostochiensis TaxID=31243 RepID=A0A914I672_GLORO